MPPGLACGSVPLCSRRGRPDLEQGGPLRTEGSLSWRSSQKGVGALRLHSPAQRCVLWCSRSHSGGADLGRLPEGGSGCRLMQTPVRLSEMRAVLGCSGHLPGVFTGVFGSPQQVELESPEGELLNSFGVSPHCSLPAKRVRPICAKQFGGSPGEM